MKIPKPPYYQSVGFWLSMPFITWVYAYIFFHERIYHDFKVWLPVILVIYGVGYPSWRSHYMYDHYLRRKFPTVQQTRQRVLFKTLVNVFVMTPSVLLIFLLFQAFHVYGYKIHKEDLLYGYLLGLGVNIIFETLWELIYILEQYKETAAEKAHIEDLQLRQEFDQLKQKVNPHFLFNSFNTLSSLISEDKTRAEKFLDELSSVYRYLLRNNESGMSTVQQEAEFIHSYSKLLQTRYGDGFKVELSIDPAVKDKEIPSLSLQLLVENAVKHNIVSKQQPVHVFIRSSGNYLVIENKLNRKTNLVESTGIGLSNIKEKYRFLNHDDVTVEESDGLFRVTIPVI